MHRWIRFFFAAFALVTLVGYLLGDLVLSSGPEMMSWEEFSSNPRAVAQFRERMASASDDLQAAEDMHHAYDRYRDSVVSDSGGRQGRSEVGQNILDLKSRFQRIYLAWVPKTGFRQVLHRPLSIAVREQIGAGLTLVLLAVAIAAVSSAIAICREKARI